MKLLHLVLIIMLCCCPAMAQNDNGYKSDIIKGKTGDIKLTFIGHATLMIEHKGNVIHVDPWTKLADYAKLPQADMLLLTHEHQDHFDTAAIEQVKKVGTTVIYTEVIGEQRDDGKVFKNGDSVEIDNVLIEAVPAYNLVHKRETGEPYHPKGRGNGYILTIDGKRIYIAGDTENVPELKELKNIDVAFLPMNLPYTMTPEMVADLAKAIKPGILYPYHFGETDTNLIVELMKGNPEIEVRIRKLS
ncbi:MAG: MBL fold metallo-hydrolase [Candidatus Riflebacteria bacterium]|nr:MBL fold metallo-hydrolase [Candidatus Riflebacteria bacterium]